MCTMNKHGSIQINLDLEKPKCQFHIIFLSQNVILFFGLSFQPFKNVQTIINSWIVINRLRVGVGSWYQGPTWNWPADCNPRRPGLDSRVLKAIVEMPKDLNELILLSCFFSLYKIIFSYILLLSICHLNSVSLQIQKTNVWLAKG